MTDVTVQVRRLPHGEGLDLPRYATPGAAGMDVVAAEDVMLEPGARHAVATGLALAIPPGYEIQVRPRSGLALKHGVSVPNTPGTIDSDYRGELKVILINHGEEPFAIRRGERGQRGELDGAASANWGELERQQGYIVRIEARQLQGDQVVDSIGQYFMSLDRKEEMWALRLAARSLSSRRVVQSLTEIGARSGTSMSVTVSGSTEPRSISPFVPDTGYLNQVEMFLLPALLVRSKAGDGQAREVGFYTYQSEFNNVRLRRDAVRADASRLGAIRITTQTSEDRDPIVSIYNQRGELIQTTTADGSVREPIELPRLMDLWKRKNLPID
ncbi:dUTP diphosphatase [Leptolyngbya sp. 15MV]|nr:dUTP diphosphatase [Leptolyngbya sp. 15MV]